MDKTLYLLCKEYTRTYDLIHTLLELDLDNHERLVLFRLCQERLTLLEKDIFDNLIAKEL